MVFSIPAYVFTQTVLDGQAAVLLVVPAGVSRASVSATLNGMAGPVPFTLSGSRSDTTTASPI